MFKLGFARVAEDTTDVWVESVCKLKKAQRVFLEDKHHREKKTVHLNDQRFIEAKAKPSRS
jgi:hypothetical protein